MTWLFGGKITRFWLFHFLFSLEKNVWPFGFFIRSCECVKLSCSTHYFVYVFSIKLFHFMQKLKTCMEHSFTTLEISLTKSDRSMSKTLVRLFLKKRPYLINFGHFKRHLAFGHAQKPTNHDRQLVFYTKYTKALTPDPLVHILEHVL